MPLVRVSNGGSDFSTATLTNLYKRTYNSNMTMNVNVGDYIFLISSSTLVFGSQYLVGATVLNQCEAIPKGDDGAMAICEATSSTVQWKLGGTTYWGSAFRMEI